MVEQIRADAGKTVAGIDVGGTFTDLILIDGAAGGRVHVAKTPTTPENQAFGVVAALAGTSVPASGIGLIVHGTTTTTNAVLERRLARTGMITTRGFRDVIELGRRTRPQAYGMTGVFRPVIPRDLRLEVPERIEASGRVRTPLDEDAVREAVAALLSAGCESLVIHFLHSYANPLHERRAAEIAAESWPNRYITMGHSLLSEAREFERGVTAAVNASVQPILERYVERLRSELAELGYARDFLIMNGNGGMISARFVTAESAKTVMSGPASGVIAAAFTGRRAGYPNLVTYDMGGTSTDVALIRGGEPAVSNEIEIEYAMPIHVPMVAVHSIGRRRRFDRAGRRIGPHPTRPRKRGRRARPDLLWPRRRRADAHRCKPAARPARSREAPRGRGAGRDRPCQGGLRRAHRQAGRPRSCRRRRRGAQARQCQDGRCHPHGFDIARPRPAGLRAVRVRRRWSAARLRARPRARPAQGDRSARPGITNALGCVVADLRHDFVNTLNQPVAALDEARVCRILEDHAAEGAALIAKEAVEPDEIRCSHSADMQFVGQTHILNVPLPSGEVTRDMLQELFETAYFRRFRVALPEIRANLVNLNTSVTGIRPPVDLSRLIDPAGRAGRLDGALRESRSVWFDGSWVETPVYHREKLPLDAVLSGPAVLEQMDATTVLEPGDRAVSDADGNIVIEIGDGS